MAKRKSKKANKQAPPKKMKLETVSAMSTGWNVTGYVECNICKSGYETTVTDLTEPTDIFHEWSDHFGDLKNP